MKKEMAEELTLSIGETIPLLFNRMDFLQLVQTICHRLDSDKPVILQFTDRVLAQAQMIPLHLIPADDTEDHSISGPMYDFALTFCEYWYGVADGTKDGSDWGHKEYMKNSNSFDVNLAKCLQYASGLSETGGW